MNVDCTAKAGAVDGHIRTLENPDDEDIFARHALIPGWHAERLRDALVVVAGVGALGNEVARLLAMAGIGRLILCDPDTVSRSNLSRTVLFRESDIGRPKSSTAAEALRSLAPWTDVDARDAPLSAAVGLAELREATLVAGCLDSRAARLQLTARCQRVAVPLLDGGTSAWGGEVGFYPPDGACYGCWMTDRERAEKDDPWSCYGLVSTGVAGASAPISSVVGSWQATAAVRYCLGLSVPAGQVRIMPADGAAVIVRPRGIDATCPLHGALDTKLIEPITLDHRAAVGDLAALLDPGDEAYAWAPFVSPADRRTISIRLREAPDDARLADLGIAPREVIAVHRPSGEPATRYLELARADLSADSEPSATEPPR